MQLAGRIALSIAFLACLLLLFLEPACARRVPPEANPGMAILPATEDGWYLVSQELLDNLIESQRACAAALHECSESRGMRSIRAQVPTP